MTLARILHYIFNVTPLITFYTCIDKCQNIRQNHISPGGTVFSPPLKKNPQAELNGQNTRWKSKRENFEKRRVNSHALNSANCDTHR